MTSAHTINEATELRNEYSELVYIEDIGQSREATKLFQKLVPKSDYRLQCLHHSVVMKEKTVLFIVGKGSSHGTGSISYGVLLEFSELLRTAYMFGIDCMRSMAFTWIGNPAQYIPKQYDALLKGTHATDLYSFASFYNLSLAYKNCVANTGPLPPARMIRPTVLTFWNSLKGGVDEYSRAITSLAHTTKSENPIVSVIGRLISSQVNNAAVCHRLSIAKAQGHLPPAANLGIAKKVGYRRLRHNVSRAETFSSFARLLAKEFKASQIHVDAIGDTEHRNGALNA